MCIRLQLPFFAINHIIRLTSRAIDRKSINHHLSMPAPRALLLFLLLFASSALILVNGNSARNSCYSLKPNLAQIGEYCRSHVPKE